MKFLMIVTLLISFQQTWADVANQDMSQKVVSECAQVTPMAVLAKDNMPFWSQSNNLTQKKSCYFALREVLENGTDDDIRNIHDTFNGDVQFFVDDEDYSEFINSHKTPSPFVIESKIKTLTPVQRRPNIFFENSYP